MEANASINALKKDRGAWDLFSFLQENQGELGLEEAQLYHDFPILKDLDGEVVISQMLLVSRQHGVMTIAASSAASEQAAIEELPALDEHLEHLFSLIYSRLLRNRGLLKSKIQLAFPINAFTFAPFISNFTLNIRLESPLLLTQQQLEEHLQDIRIPPIASSVYRELLATIEGAKGIIRPKARDIQNRPVGSKGALANLLESEIASFDRGQKQGAIIGLDGLQRIRGLAGSGKTIVLAMKAALTHLRYPEARILYTFYTRSLYQHIQRLVTRFYRRFDDKDPDWSRLKIMHAWGGFNNEGVYFNAALAHGPQVMSYGNAVRRRREQEESKDTFNFLFTKLQQTVNVEPTYDYVFVDEGQHFPASFIQMCIKLAEQDRVVFAYDDLQTIFQAATPTIV